MDYLNRDDAFFMNEALKQAFIAESEDEVPVGAVIVHGNKIIAKAYNQVERLKDVTAHAEMLAITAASNFLGSKYLTDCKMYVTLEPCLMCATAIFWSKLEQTIYGAADNKKGFSTVSTNFQENEKIKFLENNACAEILKDFFKKKRNI
ncbi:MAG: nucleoside deaminase [Chitinophagaceae bacterium]|nr:MAG: nucleoside deaminase [Chitinophagaceae bacterium]